MKIKRNVKLRLYILTLVFVFTAGFCACGKDDSRQAAENRAEGQEDNSGETSDDAYDVLSVDSAIGSDIDYGKYEVEGGNETGKNDGDRNNNKTDGGSSNNNIADNKKNDSNDNAKNDNKDNDNKNNDNKDNSNNSGDGGNNKTKDNDIKPDNGSESKPEDTSATGKSTQQSNGKNINNNNINNNNSNNNNNDKNNPSTDKSKVHTCSLVIDCTVLLSNMDRLDSEKRELVPEDGIILEKHDIEFSDGESAFDVLLRETRNEKIHMEYSFTPVYNSSYIEGIANLYEFDCGELSGWVYSVNGQSPNYGISKYGLKDGDVIHIEYTLER